ncbi:MAG TPA: glycosyltransferase family 4 protein [Steroidobacteraceae bacterium]|nr:glycosyltransferase family 4 protein [Steroidobacteraceae bacterium]
MRIALVVPGGVDRSLEYRVIPALLALIGRLALNNDVQVFALYQEAVAGEWDAAGAHIRNIGSKHTVSRAMRAIRAEHRRVPFDLVQSIWSGWSGLIAVLSGSLLRIPSLIHVAGGELTSLAEIGYGGRLKWHGRMREAWNLRAAAAVTAASAPIIDALSALGVAAQRIPLGVDLTAWPPRDPVPRDPSRPARFIHVASLNRVKDQTTLLRALASLMRSGMNFEMQVVGEDTLNGEMQSVAAELGLAERVKFLGFLPQGRLRPVVEAADLMILSSRHEAGPLVMLEAAVAGVPTVGTAVGHIREWSPAAAACVPVGDSARLAETIGQLLEDEDLRLRIAREALRRATSEDANYTAERFQSLYASLL